jgi:hypothetical protein
VKPAWKLRALVYGLLLVVAALVVATRLSMDAGADAAVDGGQRLTGTTSQGAAVQMHVSGRRLLGFSIATIGADCRDRVRVEVRWAPAVGQGNVSYSRDGDRFIVHEWPDPRFTHPLGARPEVWMVARLSPDARRAEGTITYAGSGARGDCSSGPVAFSAHR